MIDHDAILKLAHNRIRPSEIANRLSLRTVQVYHSLTLARESGEDIPPFSRKSRRHPNQRFRLQPHVRDLLEPHAHARGVRISDLADKLLCVVVEEDMIDAVLDDGGDHAG